MTLRVLQAGLYTLIVDFGRPTTRSLGVPIGGAADRLSLAIGNALVGNPPDTAALEINLIGPTLQADESLACVLYGAPFSLHSDRQPLQAGVTFTLWPGELLTIGTTDVGMRGYLCVRGGLQVSEVLGSRSSLQAMKAGEEIGCTPGTIARRFVHAEGDRNRPRWSMRSTEPYGLRVVPGAQIDWFINLPDLMHFTVSPASNRMGLRLQGQPLRWPRREMLSEPVCPGTVQVTPDGQCIVLGVDGQTIGGYPKVFQVIQADLDRVGQLRPGDPVAFEVVSLEKAESLYHQRQAFLTEWTTRLRQMENLIGPPDLTAPSNRFPRRGSAGVATRSPGW